MQELPATGQSWSSELWQVGATKGKNNISGLLDYIIYKCKLNSFLWHFKSVDGIKFLLGNA